MKLNNGTNVNITNSSPQLIGNVETSIQNNYIYQPTVNDPADDTIVVVGEEMNAALGMTKMSDLFASVLRFLRTAEGIEADKALCKVMKNIHFSLEEIVEKQTDKLITMNVEEMCHKVQCELNTNTNLGEADKDLGRAVLSLFERIVSIKRLLTIDCDTMQLLEQTLHTNITDDQLIELSSMRYAPTIRKVVKEVLLKCLSEANNPVLQHISRSVFSLAELQRYVDERGQRTPQVCLYIAWLLWAYLVAEEQRATPAFLSNRLWQELQTMPCRLVSLCVTTFAWQTKADALYLNGSLNDHADMTYGNDLAFPTPIHNLLPTDFFTQQLPEEFGADGHCMPMPTFVGHLISTPTTLSHRFLKICSKASEMMKRAKRIVVLGWSFAKGELINQMLCSAPTAHFTFIGNNIETLSQDVCQLFALNPHCRSVHSLNGHKHYIYQNRIHIIEAELRNLTTLPKV